MFDPLYLLDEVDLGLIVTQDGLAKAKLLPNPISLMKFNCRKTNQRKNNLKNRRNLINNQESNIVLGVWSQINYKTVPTSHRTSTLGIDIGPLQQRERSDVGGLSSYGWSRKVGPRIIPVTS